MHIDSDLANNSPCVRNCCLNDEDICLGCFRTLAEITEWHQADGQRRQTIVDTSKKRKINYQNLHREPLL